MFLIFPSLCSLFIHNFFPLFPLVCFLISLPLVPYFPLLCSFFSPLVSCGIYSLEVRITDDGYQTRENLTAGKKGRDTPPNKNKKKSRTAASTLFMDQAIISHQPLSSNGHRTRKQQSGTRQTVDRRAQRKQSTTRLSVNIDGHKGNSQAHDYL